VARRVAVQPRDMRVLGAAHLVPRRGMIKIGRVRLAAVRRIEHERQQVAERPVANERGAATRWITVALRASVFALGAAVLAHASLR